MPLDRSILLSPGCPYIKMLIHTQGKEEVTSMKMAHEDMQPRLSCVDCGVVNCRDLKHSWPPFCITASLSEEELKEALALYQDDEENHRIALASATTEADFYCKYTRVEDTMEFAKRIGARKIGIATCVGLIDETRILARILRLNGFEVYGTACKLGAVPKHEIGIPEYCEETSGKHMCNPILQAKILNKAGTNLNIIVGLCVGHDSLFIKYSEALVTTLIAKDRVLAHNPAACLYQTKSYYKKLLQKAVIDWNA